MCDSSSGSKTLSNALATAVPVQTMERHMLTFGMCFRMASEKQSVSSAPSPRCFSNAGASWTPATTVDHVLRNDIQMHGIYKRKANEVRVLYRSQHYNMP